jgi:putative DNA primase/helicase
MNITAEHIVRALGGSGGSARCPAHDDDNPSLSVSDGPNGKVLVHCHAGCSQEAVIAALKSRGLWEHSMNTRARPYRERQEKNTAMDEYDDFRKVVTILRAAAGAFGKPFSEWPGANERARPTAYLQGRGITFVPVNAMLLSQRDAVKLQDRIPGFKAFPAMVMPIVGPKGLQGASVTYLDPHATRNLYIEGKSVRRIYGQRNGGYVPIGKFNRDHPIKLAAEGIEDAASLHILTKCPAIAVLGKGNFTAADVLQCPDLILGGDNDKDGKGREKAEEAAQILTHANRRVRVAIPANYKDWNEALCDPNADHAQLRNAILNAEPITEKVEVGAISVAEFMDFTFPQRDFLLEPWLTSDSITMIHAFRGNGKTWLALSIAFAIAKGEHLLGWKTHKKARVLYVDGELSGEQLQSRLKLFGCCPDNLFILSRHLLYVHQQDLDLGTEEGRNYLDQIIERNGIEVIILDSISTLVRSGVENDAEHWVPIADWGLTHRWSGRALIYMAHEGLSGRPRGTTKREDPFDTMIKLKQDKEQSTDDVSAFELSYTKHRDFFGADTRPMLISLGTRDGLTWTHGPIKDAPKERVKEMLDNGMKQTEIAKQLGVSRQRVSQMVREAKREKQNGKQKDVV